MNAETKIDKLKDLLPVLIEQYTAMADVMDTIYTRTQGRLLGLWAARPALADHCLV